MGGVRRRLRRLKNLPITHTNLFPFERLFFHPKPPSQPTCTAPSQPHHYKPPTTTPPKSIHTPELTQTTPTHPRYWDKVDFDLPYNKETLDYRRPSYLGAAFDKGLSLLFVFFNIINIIIFIIIFILFYIVTIVIFIIIVVAFIIIFLSVLFLFLLITF